MQALDFSGAFRSVVGHLRLPPGAYVPDLMEPEGLSTSGGKQALQRIRLVPSNDGYPTLVVGGANVKSGRAQLRSYDYVDAAHRQHFGKAAPLDRKAYNEFLELVKNYFAIARLEVTVEESPTPAAEEPSAPPSRLGLAVVGLLGLLTAGAVVYYVMSH